MNILRRIKNVDLKNLLVQNVFYDLYSDKKPTKQVSFELFKSGLSVKEIATERNLTPGTIEGHLANFIPTGEIDVLELIELKRYKKIVKAIEITDYKTLTELKEKIDKTFTFMEIRMVLLAIEN